MINDELVSKNNCYLLSCLTALVEFLNDCNPRLDDIFDNNFCLA